jgi:hypothetical protein
VIVQVEIDEQERAIFLHVLTVGRWALPPLEAQRLTNELSHALVATGLLDRRRDSAVLKGAGAPSGRCPGLRAFDSEDHARAAHRKAGFRFRAFRCEGCGRWHVSADEKNGRRKGARRGGR